MKAARRYLDSIRNSDDLTSAVLAIDSQVEATRDLGLELLDSRRSRSMKNGSGTPSPNQTTRSSEPGCRRIADEEWPDETRLDDFDRRVLVTAAGGGRQEKIKQRLETHLPPPPRCGLNRSAPGRCSNSRRARLCRPEWALQRLAILQLQGVHLDGLDVRLTTEGSGQ